MATALFSQTHSGMTADYSVKYGDTETFAAHVPINYAGYCANLFQNGEQIYQLKWDSSANIKNLPKIGTNKELAIYDIIDSTLGICGHICRKRNKNFWGYFFFEMSFNDETYIMYEVGLGKQGIKLPIYKGTSQIALIEKDTITINNKDKYVIHSHLGKDLLIATLFSLYYDYLRFGHHGEISVASKKTFTLYSTNKELKSKYDPMWKISGSN